MALKLYYDLLSQPSRSVFILLQTCKIPFERCPVALRKGEHLTEEYKKEISRFQKVPVIKDGDFKLTERYKWIDPLLTGKQPDPNQVVKYEKNMANSIDSVEKLFLKESPFIAGDQISAADIWAACELEQPRITGFDPEAGRPVLSQWLNNVRKALSPHYEEAHSILNKLSAKSGPRK